MKKISIMIKEIGITFFLLALFFGICLFVQQFLNIHPLIPMVFTLAVFLVSRFTTGYFLGILASLISVMAVNYAFTFPHFRFNFTISENLISVTKIDDGKLHLHIADTSVEELVDVVLAKFKRRYPEQDIFLSMPDTFVSLQIDPILIEQVILNILENAMQHAKGMKTLSFTICKYGDKISFEITDDGCGIPKEILFADHSSLCQKWRDG